MLVVVLTPNTVHFDFLEEKQYFSSLVLVGWSLVLVHKDTPGFPVTAHRKQEPSLMRNYPKMITSHRTVRLLDFPSI